MGLFQPGIGVGLPSGLIGNGLGVLHHLLTHPLFPSTIVQGEAIIHVLHRNRAGAGPAEQPDAVQHAAIQPQHVGPVVIQGDDRRVHIIIKGVVSLPGGAVRRVEAPAGDLSPQGEVGHAIYLHPHRTVATLYRSAHNLVDADILQGVVAGLLPGVQPAVQGTVNLGVGRRGQHRTAGNAGILELWGFQLYGYRALHPKGRRRDKPQRYQGQQDRRQPGPARSQRFFMLFHEYPPLPVFSAPKGLGNRNHLHYPLNPPGCQWGILESPGGGNRENSPKNRGLPRFHLLFEIVYRP